jgi:hypothetical protein
MLLRRLLSAGVVLAFLLPLCAVDLYGQEDKDKKKDKQTEKTKEKAPADKGGDKATLKWKFEKDKTFYQKMDTTTEQTMTVNTNTVKQTQKQTFYFSWKVDKVDGDTVVLTQTILGVVMDIDIGGSKISYDSTATAANNAAAAGANNPLSEFFKQLVNKSFKVTLNTKDLKVTKVEGRQEFLDALVKANQQMKPLLEQILSDKALIEMAEPTFAVLPTEPQPKGGTWSRKTSLDMGPIGKYDNEYKYTYEGKDETPKKEDKIKVETTLKYTPPTAEAAGVGGLPFKIKSADLKSTNATGMVYFDEAKGRVDRSNLSLDLKGELSIEIGGQTTKVELQQNQKTNVETSDEMPEALKKKA